MKYGENISVTDSSDFLDVWAVLPSFWGCSDDQGCIFECQCKISSRFDQIIVNIPHTFLLVEEEIVELNLHCSKLFLGLL